MLPEITLTCGGCGADITTRAAAGSSARCPGCGRTKKVPAGRTTTALPAAVVAITGWHPTPVEVEVEASEYECPDCDTPLVWEPAGTLLWCECCEEPLFPPELEPSAPDTADPRRVATQAERDALALAVAERRAIVLDAIGRVLDDDKLTPASRGRLEWYQAEVGKATSMARVAELAEALGNEKVRRRGWFTPDATNPAQIIDAEIVDDEDQDDEEDQDDDEEYDDEDQAPLAIAAPAAAAESRREFDLRNYRINLDAPPGHCQVVAPARWSGDPVSHYPCGGAGLRVYAGVRVCDGHRDALCRPLDRR
jgi:predicted RNA-binding Zn-ribbon protein involved in translation (DUF1610 family)